jgi:hypothetical protein
MSYPGPPYYPEEFDFPNVEFEKVEVRVARVPHRCSSCSQPIKPGSRYTRVFAVVDGEPQTQLSHGRVIGECMGA